MYTYVYMCKYINVTHKYICETYIHTYLYIYVFACDTHVNICIDTSKIFAYFYTCIHIRVHMMKKNVYMQMDIYIYAHT